ncbi:hypothetical protein VN1000_07080 [Helicobacter pylori]
MHKKEIDTLLKKKVLCNFEMHGEGDLESALKDKNTNYLIKGNNLIALHSLKKKFAKQVKCIYIDPPPIIRAMTALITTIISTTAHG